MLTDTHLRNTGRYQAVILAAGRGSRLTEQTDQLPKALLPIGQRSSDDPTPTSFLRRQVELLADLGVDQVVVAVGYRREQVTAAIADWAPWVRTVVNPTPDIGTSGSLHSFQFALNAGLGLLDGERQTLLMDGDIVYQRQALARLLDAPVHSALLVSAKYRGDDEEVLVYGTADAPRFLGKGLTAELVGDQPCLGEAVGIVKFAPQDHALVRQTVNWLLGDPNAPDGSLRHRGFGPARRATEHEELTGRLMQLGRMGCVHLGDEYLFMEVDDAEEYATMRREFYPRLLTREADAARAAGAR